MNTEITETTKLNGWVLYDANCRFCTRVAHGVQHLLATRHFELLPLQTPWVKERLNLPESQLLAEMRLLRPEGRLWGGADALLEIGRHFWWACLISAGALMPRAVNLRTHIATLPPFIQRLFWVYYAFIGLCLVSFGVITITFAGTLAAGGGLARALCAFFTLFWTIRLIAATFVFDVRPYLTNQFWRLGYHATNIVFIYLPVVYAYATLK